MDERYLTLDGALNGGQHTLSEGHQWGYELTHWPNGEPVLALANKPLENYVVIFFNGTEHTFRAHDPEEAEIALEEQYFAYGGDVSPDDVIWWGRVEDRPENA